MVSLKKITDQSWLVLTDDGGNKVGLLSKNREKFTLLAKEGARTSFENEEEIKTFFNQDIFNNMITVKEKEKVHFINGFPVDFHDPYEADCADSDLPLFTKTQKGTVYHCAGYYVIHFPKGPIRSFCPKLATLTSYEYEGPFKTELEMKTALSQAKKRLKSQK